MSHISQEILDSLTRFEMPGPVSQKERDSAIDAEGTKLGVFRCGALILGSGAAGLRAAVELKRRNVDVVVASSRLFGGTSACSGSDKQTLHTACTGNRGDDFLGMAREMSSGGCMDMDTAYIESVGSIYALSSLLHLGLPLPQDSYGAILRYKTDHDEAGRATSCGPLTSRLMTKVLCEEAIRLGVPFLTGRTGVRILAQDGIAGGLFTVDSRDGINQYGLNLVLFDKLVLATGGPGELYRDSVYPKGCFGALGMAMQAGAEAVNLTESQFGISTNRDRFPWNLSGTYVQVMPRIYSVDADGHEHNFLANYYRTTRELASNIFRKGYQWPFQVLRLPDHGSSLIDLAVFMETSKGRQVFMDFKRNPYQVPGDKPFSLHDLDDDARAYLENSGGLGNLPIDRLRAMNPPAVELYKAHGIDITREPLQFSVNNQHLNGGLGIDNWGQTSLRNCYAVGEAAGTHGVTRPGGAALNSGQVFATRCAQHIAANISPSVLSESEDEVTSAAAAILRELKDASRSKGALAPEIVKKEVQARMSDKAGFICDSAGVSAALDEARELNGALLKNGLQLDSPEHAALYFQVKQTALASEAVLTALNHYIENGGGSRGARAILSKDGTMVPKTSKTSLDGFRFREEDLSDRKKKVVIQYNNGSGEFRVAEREVRADLNLSEISFEKNWAAYLAGDICR